MKRIGVMQMVDTLAAGGTERVAVNLANALPRDRYAVHLCTTRADGPLAACLADDVGRLRLDRRRTLEGRALWRLSRFLCRHNIALIHAHASALFTASLASLLPPFPRVVWHDHFGQEFGGRQRPVWLFRLLTRRAQAVLAVTERLAQWSRERLRFPAQRVWYIPNFVARGAGRNAPPELPGTAGFRLVCVANIRPPKDHLNLIAALELVVRRTPQTHLLLVGNRDDQRYVAAVEADIARRGLHAHVSFLGQRQDVPAILRSCDLGVVASSAEGLPLSLLEYGLEGLPAVATRVGQCGDVLADGAAGVLVPPQAPAALADAIVALLCDAPRRAALAAAFERRVQSVYSAQAVIDRIATAYDVCLHGEPRHAG